MKIERVLGGLVSLGVVAALCVPGVLAKNQAAPAQQGEMGMRDKLQSAVESLNLTDDQKPKVKDIVLKVLLVVAGFLIPLAAIAVLYVFVHLGSLHWCGVDGRWILGAIVVARCRNWGA